MALSEPTVTIPGIWPRRGAERHGVGGRGQSLQGAQGIGSQGVWYAWHWLRLRSREDGEFGEADFFIADPNRPGILILEVKGGEIEERHPTI